MGHHESATPQRRTAKAPGTRDALPSCSSLSSSEAYEWRRRPARPPGQLAGGSSNHHAGPPDG
eukprot:5705919-Pyramimonas_sp.AAC.1